MDVNPSATSTASSPLAGSGSSTGQAPGQTFEDALAQLETIVKRLESDSTSLDDSLKLFEEGVRLSRYCSGRLDDVEKKVLLLMEDRDGNLTSAPFEAPEG